jgi:hypothetical protein
MPNRRDWQSPKCRNRHCTISNSRGPVSGYTSYFTTRRLQAKAVRVVIQRHAEVCGRCPFLHPIADSECGAFMSTRPSLGWGMMASAASASASRCALRPKRPAVFSRESPIADSRPPADEVQHFQPGYSIDCRAVFPWAEHEDRMAVRGHSIPRCHVTLPVKSTTSGVPKVASAVRKR